MTTMIMNIADLPRKTVTEIKRQWSSVIREVHATGAIAVTSRDHIEAMVLSVERYQELTGLAAASHQAGLDLLAARFEPRLERMKAGTIQAGAAAFMADDGDFLEMETPPLVGSF